MTTHIFAIIDKSGSMESVRDATISGFNEYLLGIRKEPTDIKFSLTLFDTNFDKRLDSVDVATVPDLTRESYIPDGGTALIDAVCSTLNSQKGKVSPEDKALVVIITDGQENSSREYNSKQMRDLVKELEAKGNWTFTYLGANQDAWAEAQKFGMQMGNVATFTADSVGTAKAFQTVAVNSSAFARSATMSVGNFYSEKDKEELLNSR